MLEEVMACATRGGGTCKEANGNVRATSNAGACDKGARVREAHA